MNEKMKMVLIIIALVFGSCLNNNILNTNISPYWGEWEKLTVLESGDTVRIELPDAYNPKIIANKSDSTIFVRYGIEDIVYDIIDVIKKKNVYVFTVKFSKQYISNDNGIRFKLAFRYINNELGLWAYYTDDNEEVLFTSKPVRYRIEVVR